MKKVAAAVILLVFSLTGVAFAGFFDEAPHCVKPVSFPVPVNFTIGFGQNDGMLDLSWETVFSSQGFIFKVGVSF